MKFVQITDIHIAPEGVFTLGVDVRKNFLEALSMAKSLQPDLLVLTGDLSFDTGDEMVYRWIKANLDELDLPYALIAGNHDDPALLARVFEMEHLLCGGELYYKCVFGLQPVFFLETSSGAVSDRQLDWIQRELEKTTTDIILFMHHPPVLGGVLYMDRNYPMRDVEKLQSVLLKFPHRISVFCGHYHAEKVVGFNNLSVHITPSTYFQMNWRSEEFRLDHFRPALREIIVRKDGSIESTVIYWEGHRN